MQGSKPLRFVVGSALLLGAPLLVGCEEAVESPNVNTTAPPTVAPEGEGVPLPSTEEPSEDLADSELLERPHVNVGPDEPPPDEPPPEERPPEEPPSPMRTNSGPFRRAPVIE